MVATKGSAPGTASSVRPALAFGALARNDGVSGITLAEGDKAERIEVGEAVHVHPGEFASAMEFASRIGGVRCTGDIGFFLSRTVPRHESISSSLMGEAPLRPNGEPPLR